jgi:integrase
MKELDAYKVWLETSKAKTTAEQYYGTVRDFVESLDKLVKDIDIIDVTKYSQKVYRELSHDSADRYVDRIRSFLQFVDKDSLAFKMPKQKLRIDPNSDDTLDEELFIPEEQMQILLQYAAYPADMAALQLGYHFAMRVGEVALLHRDWFDYEQKILKLYRLKSRSPWQSLPFDHGSTSIHDTYGVLRSYLVHRGNDDNKYMIIPDKKRPEDGISGKMIPITSTTLERMLQRAIERAAKDRLFFKKLVDQKVSFHILRHSKATNMIIYRMQHDQNPSLIAVAKWLNHANYNTTMRYVHLAAKYLGRPEIESYL